MIDKIAFNQLLSVAKEAEPPAYAIDTFTPFAIAIVISVTLALFAACLICRLAMRNLINDNPDAKLAYTKFVKITIFAYFIFAAIMGIVLLALSIAKNYSASYAEENWLMRSDLIVNVLVPIIVVLAVIIISSIVLAILYNTKKAAFRPARIICGLCMLGSIIYAAIMIGMYYSKNIAEDGYYNSDTTSVNSVVLYISAAILVILSFALGIIFDRQNKKEFDTRTMAYAGICVALSFALSYVRIIHLPQGGSITFASLLPLMLFSYIYGSRKGVFVGCVYGILQAVQDPWIIHPAQFLLDYPIAFSFIGLSGIFSNVKALKKLPQIKFALGAIIASLGRYISHVLSGVFAFSAYAEGANPWAYSLAYNSFVLADIVIVIVVGVLLFSSKSFVKTVELQQRRVPVKKSDESSDGCVTTNSDGLTHSDTHTKDNK